MPIRTAPDAREREKVAKALERLRAKSPDVAKLKERARRGSLQTNLNTLATESGVPRHRIEKLYPDLAAAATADRGERGDSVPLRSQLDAARRDKQLAERRLDQSRTYSFHLFELVSKLRTEKRLLEERVAELEAAPAVADAGLPFMGTDNVLGIPPMPAGKTRSRRTRAAA